MSTRIRFVNKLVLAASVWSIAGVLSVPSVMAEETPAATQQAPAACFIAPAKLDQARIDAFLGNPKQLLTNFGGGGLPLANEVRSLAGSSSTALDAILAQVPSMTSQQKTAVGAGLARVARACAATSPEYAQMIQAKVASLQSPEMITAFVAATAETQTAALGNVNALGGGTARSGNRGSALGGTGTAGGTSGTGTTGTTTVTNGSSQFSVNGGGQYFASSTSQSTQ